MDVERMGQKGLKVLRGLPSQIEKTFLHQKVGFSSSILFSPVRSEQPQQTAAPALG
jgi:hypothetical protein